MERCLSKDELAINFMHESNLSSWASSVIDKYYPLEEQRVVVANPFDNDSIAGWPYVFMKFTSVDEINRYYNLSLPYECRKHVKISSTHKSSNYYFVEVAYGCGRSGDNRYIYVLKEYRGKVIIDSKFYSNITY